MDLESKSESRDGPRVAEGGAAKSSAERLRQLGEAEHKVGGAAAGERGEHAQAGYG